LKLLITRPKNLDVKGYIFLRYDESINGEGIDSYKGHDDQKHHLPELKSREKFVNQGSISSTFYEQLLLAQIPKAQKKTYNLTVFFVLLGSALKKAAYRMLIKLTPVVNFINILQVAFANILAPNNYKA